MSKRMMMTLVTFMAATAASATSPALPGKGQAAAAYTRLLAEPCRQMIDVCAADARVVQAQEIGNLVCKPAAADTAQCKFDVEAVHCTARFTRSDVAGEGGWQAARGRMHGVPRALLVECE